MNTVDALISDSLPLSLLERPIGPPGPRNHLHEIWIAIRVDGVADVDGIEVTVVGDGTRYNPYDGSTARKFDYIMFRLAAPQTLIHLAPGVFRSGGGAGNSVAGKWAPRSGQKIIGSGMYVTTLLLTIYNVDPEPLSGIYSQILINSDIVYLEGFEVSDLTLDCGMDDQPLPVNARYAFPQIMTGAIAIGGRNVAIRRARIVNYGTRTPAFMANVEVSSYEAYTFQIRATAARTIETVSFNQLVEDCLFEQPYNSNGRECTPLNTGPGSPIGTAKGMALRRCYFNMEFVNRLPYPATRVARIIYTNQSVTIGGYTYAAGTVQTIETVGFHNLKGGEIMPDGKPTGVFAGNIPRPFYVEISGAVGNTAYNGRFLVLSPEINDGSSRTLQIQMSADPGNTLPTGNMTLQDSPSPTLDVFSLSKSGAVVTVTTAAKHKRMAGDWVVISGADVHASGASCNGTFQVKATNLTEFVFEYDLPDSADRPTTGMIALDRRPSFRVRIKKLTRVWGNTWTVETHEPHYRKPNEWSALEGVMVSDFVDRNGFTSYLRIERVIDPTHFEVTVENPFDLADYFDLFWEEIAESVYDPVTSNPPDGEGVIGTDFQPYQVGYAPLMLVERNRVTNSIQGGNYHDTWTQIDHVARKNYHYNVSRGVHENLLGSVGTWISAEKRGN